MMEKDKNLNVAVIMINYHDYADRFLADCIASLRQVNFSYGKFDIVVVDNDSSYQTRKLIQEIAPEVRIVVNKENIGFGAGNNSAVEAIKELGYDYYLFLNMDVEVESDFINYLVETAQSKSDIGSVQSRIMLFEDKTKINSLGNKIHFLGFGYSGEYKQEYSGQEVSAEIVYPSGCSVLVPSEVFEKIGRFTPEFFMYHDDMELGLKIRLLGLKNYIAFNSVIFHKYEFSRSIAKYYWMERNRLIVWAMIFKFPTLILWWPAWLVMEIGLNIFAIKGGWWREKFKVYKWFLNWENLNDLLNWREKALQLRKVGDREIIRGFSGKIEFQDSDVDNWVVQKIANPIFNIYFQISKFLIFW